MNREDEIYERMRLAGIHAGDWLHWKGKQCNCAAVKRVPVAPVRTQQQEERDE